MALEPDSSPIVGAGAMIKLLPHLTAGSITPVRLPIREYMDSDGGFDIVYMRQTAHHFSVLEEGIANSVELLKPKGLFLMTREHVADTPQDVEIFKQRHPGTQYGIEEQAYSINRYREALTRGGLTEIRVWGSHDSVINFYPTQPEVLVMDEWLSVGDTDFRSKAEEKLVEFIKKTSILVLASNSLEPVKKICNRTVTLEHGRIAN